MNAIVTGHNYSINATNKKNNANTGFTNFNQSMQALSGEKKGQH